MLSSHHSPRRPTSFAGLSISALVLGLAASAMGETPTVPLAMPVPSVLSASQYLGPLSASTRLSMAIALAPSNRAAFEAYADSVADRNSPNYRKFLTPKEIGTRFGASASTVNTTVAYLKSKGLKIAMIADNRMAVLFTGTPAQAEAAFGARLGAYRGPSVYGDGATQDFYFYQTPPKAPRSIASKVVTISGLESYFKPKKRSTLTPTQTRALYNVASIYNADGLNRKGEGINVGIANYDGIRLSNVPLFYNQFNLPAPAGGVGSNIVKVGFDPELEPASGEGDLDVQMVLAIAPKCNLYIYTNDHLSNLVRMGQDNKVDIVTESYGWATNESTRSAIQSWHDQHVALSAQGITYTLATGDYGTDLQGFDYPDFDPEIVQVGGTVATVDGSGRRITEEGWVGSGSGWSTFDIAFNRRPSWQQGATVPSSPDRRIFPDLATHAHGANKTFDESSDASDFGYEIFLGNQLTVSSGTSASSPNFAGQLAVILQELVASEGLEVDPGSGRPRLGPIQKSHIYPVWDGRSDLFYDTTTGDAGKLPDGTESVGKVGWDFVTGYGAPNAEGILNAFLEEFAPPVVSEASDAEIYSTIAPSITFGTAPQGDATSLSTTDGLAYSVQSIKQNGVGQVAAAEIDFNLTTDAAKRRSAKLKLSLQAPRLVSEFVYLYNFNTRRYDVVKTLPGYGTTTSVEFNVDLNKYVQNNQIRVLVRGLKPTRLGSASFRLDVDQLILSERVATN